MQGSEVDEARFKRRKQKDQGYDSQQQQQQRNFTHNIEQAVTLHSKKALSSSLQQQLQYFGNKIEPFNMRQQQRMGEIDQDGFFVFSRKRGYRDAWLDSIAEQNEENAIDAMRKRIKEDGRELGVEDGDRKINEAYDPREERQQNEEEQSGEEQGQEEAEKKDGMSQIEIKTLLADLLPFGSTANKYLKQLKKSKDSQSYQKILFLCNEYISVTGQHDIMTLSKQDLQQQIQQAQLLNNQEEPLASWSESQQEQSHGQEQGEQRHEEQQDEDAIFE